MSLTGLVILLACSIIASVYGSLMQFHQLSIVVSNYFVYNCLFVGDIFAFSKTVSFVIFGLTDSYFPIDFSHTQPHKCLFFPCLWNSSFFNVENISSNVVLGILQLT